MATAIKTENKTLLHGRWWQVREVLREPLVNFFREDSLMVSASIAYYSLLGLFPMLLLLLSVSGIFIRRFELSGRAGPGFGTLPAGQGRFHHEGIGRHFAGLWKGQHLVVHTPVMELFRRLPSHRAGPEPGVGRG